MLSIIMLCACIVFLIMLVFAISIENNRLENGMNRNYAECEAETARANDLQKKIDELKKQLDEANDHCIDTEEDLAREEEQRRGLQQQLAQMTQFKDEIIVTTLAVGVTMLVLGGVLSTFVVTRAGFTVN